MMNNTDFDFARRLHTVSTRLDSAIDNAHVVKATLSDNLDGLDSGDDFTLMELMRDLAALDAALDLLYNIDNDLFSIVADFREERIEEISDGKEAQPEH